MSNYISEIIIGHCVSHNLFLATALSCYCIVSMNPLVSETIFGEGHS